MQKKVSLTVAEKRGASKRGIIAADEHISRKTEGDGPLGSSDPNCKPREKGEYQSIGGGGCEDPFDRIESIGTGWGTGPLGEWNLEAMLATPPEQFVASLSVDGAVGLMTLNGADQEAGWAWINGHTGTKPIEILCKYAFEFEWDGDNIEFALALDGAPNPRDSTAWIQFFLHRAIRVGTFALHSWQLEFSINTSVGGYEEVTGLFESAPVMENTVARWDLWMRLRIESTGEIRARVWQDMYEEPVAWTMEDLTGGMEPFEFPNVGMWLVPDSNGVYFTRFEIDSFEITDGCNSTDGSVQDTRGNSVLQIVNGRIVDLLLGGIPLSCKALRLSATEYQISSNAKYIRAVSIDFMSTRQFLFQTPNTILFPSPIGVDASVWVQFIA